MVITRDQQIRKALEVLGPPPRQRAECQHDIEVALNMVERRAATARAFRVASSKRGKAGLKRYHAALRRLRSLPFSRSGDQALVQPRRNSIHFREAHRNRPRDHHGRDFSCSAVTVSAAGC